MRWKPQMMANRQGSARPSAETRPETSAETTAEKVCAGLQARGVEASAAEFLATRIASQIKSGDRAAYEAVLDGVAMSFDAQTAAAEQLADGAAGLHEVERLMGSFATELGKLDEVLEVLAAYLRRMRVAVGPEETPRILH